MKLVLSCEGEPEETAYVVVDGPVSIHARLEFAVFEPRPAIVEIIAEGIAVEASRGGCALRVTPYRFTPRRVVVQANANNGTRAVQSVIIVPRLGARLATVLCLLGLGFGAYLGFLLVRLPSSGWSEGVDWLGPTVATIATAAWAALRPRSVLPWFGILHDVRVGGLAFAAFAVSLVIPRQMLVRVENRSKAKVALQGRDAESRTVIQPDEASLVSMWPWNREAFAVSRPTATVIKRKILGNREDYCVSDGTESEGVCAESWTASERSIAERILPAPRRFTVGCVKATEDVAGATGTLVRRDDCSADPDGKLTAKAEDVIAARPGASFQASSGAAEGEIILKRPRGDGKWRKIVKADLAKYLAIKIDATAYAFGSSDLTVSAEGDALVQSISVSIPLGKQRMLLAPATRFSLKVNLGRDHVGTLTCDGGAVARDGVVIVAIRPATYAVGTVRAGTGDATSSLWIRSAVNGPQPYAVCFAAAELTDAKDATNLEVSLASSSPPEPGRLLSLPRLFARTEVRLLTGELFGAVEVVAKKDALQPSEADLVVLEVKGAPSGAVRGELDSRSWFSLWTNQLLRRSDLANGLVVMSRVGELAGNQKPNVRIDAGSGTLRLSAWDGQAIVYKPPAGRDCTIDDRSNREVGGGARNASGCPLASPKWKAEKGGEWQKRGCALARLRVCP
jgi:hypothetical protein